MKKDLNYIDKIKELALVGLVSDDTLMETLVLKGGNAMSLAHGIGSRSSYDLDLSMEGDFKEDLEKVKKRMERALSTTFFDAGYQLFDFQFQLKPKKVAENIVDFWGGYEVNFKIIDEARYNDLKGNPDNLRRNALSLSPDNSTKFSIDISKYEYVQGKIQKQLGGYTFLVYSLEMIVLEKVRAICQQLPEYAEIVKSSTQRNRARDFYDIYTILEQFDIDIQSISFKQILRAIFDVKRVPHYYLKKMKKHKAIHEKGFVSVKDTISASERQGLKDFDFYFDYVISKFETILD
jgi:predicted nucleotidyltransferase component of viral defense system